MGLETRERGGVYYYRKRRIGGRVVSEYVGGGDLACIANARAEIAKSRQNADRKLQREEREGAAATDKTLAALSGVIDTLVSATLVMQGYHKHKGEWRCRRDKNGNAEHQAT